jgi:hypothetical protein
MSPIHSKFTSSGSAAGTTAEYNELVQDVPGAVASGGSVHFLFPENRMSTTQTDQEKQSFAEAALRLSGKSDEEVRRTGAMDKADEQVEALFAARFQTTSSPVHRAVWDRGVPTELFVSQPPRQVRFSFQCVRKTRT